MFVGPESLIPQGLGAGAVGAVSALASAFPELVADAVREPGSADLGAGARGDGAVPAAGGGEARRWRGAACRSGPMCGVRCGRSPTRSGRSSRRGSNRRCRRWCRRRVDRVPPRAARREGRRARGPGPRSRPARRERRWAVSGSSSPRRRRCGSRRRARSSSASSARRCSRRWGTCFSRRATTGWERLRARAEMQAGLGVPVEEVDPARVRGLRTDDVAGAVACWEDGVAEPARCHAGARAACARARRRRARADGRARARARRARGRMRGVVAGALSGAADQAAVPAARRRRVPSPIFRPTCR